MYPRPQLMRKNYTILNGIWKYAFTDEDVRPVIWDGDIRVPFSPETYLSNVQRQLKPEEFLWYERRLIIDWIPMEKRLLLNFGGYQALQLILQIIYKLERTLCEFACRIKVILLIMDGESRR